MTRLQPAVAWRSFAAPKIHRVIEFLTSQGITVAGNLFYGFLCVRLLPISEYAKFTVVFAVLGTISLLMDISFLGSLLPLIGERTDDRQLIADYVASLRQLSDWLFLVIAPFMVIAYPLFVRWQHWSWPVVAAMVVILLVTSWCARVGGAYAAVLVVRRDRKSWYRAQMISSLGTLAMLGVFWAAHALTAFSAILLNVAGIVFVALSYFFRARHLLGVTGRSSREKRKEIIHLALPSIPWAVFYALQGQVSILLITIFGNATEVASVGALGRLGQIFMLFSQMTPLLIEPYFASLPVARLKRNYLGLMAAESALCLLVTGLARAFPGLFLWILGNHYSGLGYEVFLIMAGSSISYLYGVLYVVHSARRFVYWWNVGATIILTLAVQTYFICRVDLSTLRSVLIMNLCTCLALLGVALFTGIYGFVQGPRRIAEAPAVAAGVDHV